MDQMDYDRDDREWAEGDNLWNRIQERAKKEKTSYWEVVRKVQWEYWNEHGLKKEM